MGLFDAFSASSGTSAANRAYAAQRKGIKKGKEDISTNYGAGREALTSGKQEGLGYLDTGYQTATGDINTGLESGLGYLQSGQDSAISALQPGQDAYQGLYDRGQTGVDSYWNLINNPDQIYQSDLYKSRETAGLDALNRSAAGRGMLASGNNTQDLINYMRTGGLDYFNTLTNAYNPYFNLYGQGAGGLAQGGRDIASVYGQFAPAMGNMAYGGYADKAKLAEALAGNKSNVATGTASQVAGNFMGQGNQLADLSAQLGQAGAQRAADIYGAEQTASGNMWDAILGVGKLATAFV